MNLANPVTLWTLSGIVGTIICTLSARDAIGDLRDLGEIRNGRRRLAISNIRDEVVRAVVLLSWAVLGILYLQTDTSPRVSVVAWVIIAGNLALTLNSILRWADRSYIRRASRMAKRNQDPTRIPEDIVQRS